MGIPISRIFSNLSRGKGGWSRYRLNAIALPLLAFESGVLDLPDFYFTGDDYRYRLEPEAKERFLDLLRERFNSAVNYKGHAFKWDTIIEQKTVELGRYLVARIDGVDFSEPSSSLRRTAELELRRRILSLTQQDAQKLGIGKTTLHYLRKRAKTDLPIKIYNLVRKRLRNTQPPFELSA
jgi:hypothetical protein